MLLVGLDCTTGSQKLRRDVVDVNSQRKGGEARFKFK